MCAVLHGAIPSSRSPLLKLLPIQFAKGSGILKVGIARNWMEIGFWNVLEKYGAKK